MDYRLHPKLLRNRKQLRSQNAKRYVRGRLDFRVDTAPRLDFNVDMRPRLGFRIDTAPKINFNTDA